MTEVMDTEASGEAQRSPPLLRVLTPLAGLGAAFTALGFALIAARLVAAELPASEGLDFFGIRYAISLAVRQLAILVLLVILLAVPLAILLERGERPGGSRRLRPVLTPERRAWWGLAAYALLMTALIALTLAVAPRWLPAWVVLLLGLAVAVYGVRALRPLLLRHADHVLVRLLLVAPALLTLALSPLAVGVAAGVVIGTAFWLLHTDNERKLMALSPGGHVVIGVVVTVSVVVGYALYTASTPPIVFERALVRLSTGRVVVGGYVGRHDGDVVLARCIPTKSGGTVVSRRAHFVVVRRDRIRSLRITAGGYAFDPGRPRTLLGTLAALAPVGPDVGSGWPWRARGPSSTSASICR